jgi:hypothetical protein
MNLVLRLASVLWWLAVGIWFAMIVTAGISAAFVFGNLKPTGLVLPDHPVSEALHWRYAAGRVMIDVFATVDIGQAVAAVLGTVAIIGLAIGAPALRRRWSFRVQVIAFAIAIASFASYATMLAPSMNRTLRDQWAAAQAGDEVEAERLRAAFDEGHQASRGRLNLSFASILVAGAAAAIGAAPRGGDGTAKSDSALEEPRLRSMPA